MSYSFKRLLLICIVVISVGSCGPLIPPSEVEQSFYVINDDRSSPSEKVLRQNMTLLVREAKGNRFVNSHKILFSEDAYSRGFYQLAQWVEPPTERITSMLIDRIHRAKAFTTVSRLTSSTLGDVQLNMELYEFYHDISSRPGNVRVSIGAELISTTERSVLGEKKFERVVPVTIYSAKGALDGFTVAVNDVLNDIVVWSTTVASKDKKYS